MSARRSRPRPRRRQQPTKSRLAPCVYRPDATLPDPADADWPLCHCGLSRRHTRHDTSALDAAQAEHLRRIGDDS